MRLPISPASDSHARSPGLRRGYTLIEMVVVTAILAMLAALVMPHLVALQRSRMQRDQVAAILRLPDEARNLAKQNNTPMVLHLDGDSLLVEADTDAMQTNTNTSPLQRTPSPMGNAAGNDVTVQKRVTLGNDIQVVAGQLNSDNVDPGSWRWEVYPDGSAAKAGLEFDIDGNRKSLYIPSEGPVRWVEGELPDPTQEHWTVGDLEQRVTPTQ